MLRHLSRGAVLLTICYVFAELCTLGRTSLLAHHLLPAEMGIAVLMMTILRLIEMLTDVAADRILLQAKDGATRQTEALAHGTGVLRGLAGCLLLLTIAAVSQPLLPAGAGGWLYVMAGVPLIRAFMHLDYRIMNRHMRYGPVLIVEGGGALAGLLAVIPALEVEASAGALAAACVVQVLTSVTLSWMIAKRSFRMSFGRAGLLRFWHHGWPFMGNALFMYAVLQGERLAAGALFGLEELGRYGLLSQLALLPALLTGRIAVSLFMAPLGRRTGSQRREAERWTITGFALLAAGYFAGFIALAPELCDLLFGHAYRMSLAVTAAIAAAAGLRIAKTGVVTVLLARGDSKAVLSGNLIRALALGLGVIMGAGPLGLLGFVASAAAGEAASLASAVARLREKRTSLAVKGQTA